MKKRVPQIILSFTGLVLIVAAFVPHGSGQQLHPIAGMLTYADRNFSVWFSVLAVFAFILGGASLLSTHWQKIRSRGRDWPYSIVTLVSFIGVLVIGLFKIGGPPGLQGDVTASDSLLTLIFGHVLSPLHATLYSLLAFYIASASYRAFKVRSLPATVLLISALIVLIGRLPFGIHLTSWLPDALHFLRVEELSLWLLKVPNTAGQRAIMIGIALGVAAMSVRMIMGQGESGGGDE
jgi:hypothetical protein